MSNDNPPVTREKRRAYTAEAVSIDDKTFPQLVADLQSLWNRIPEEGRDDAKAECEGYGGALHVYFGYYRYETENEAAERAANKKADAEEERSRERQQLARLMQKFNIKGEIPNE